MLRRGGSVFFIRLFFRFISAEQLNLFLSLLLLPLFFPQPFRRRGAHASHSSRLRDPSESGGFGGRRRDGNGNGTFSSSNSTSSLSLGTKLLKLFLANWDRALVLAALIAATVLVSMRGVQFLKDALAWLQRHS
jgi:hypothetical protein